MDAVFLSRVQFALTIMFHYLFPPLTIGMGLVIVYLEGMYLKTKEAIYETAARFWTELFALSFAIGVASGIVMEFQFGTNWAVYSRFVGDVFGSPLAAEGIFAFFLESGFLAVLVFGWNKVSAPFHFFSALMVSLGSMFSAVWIIVADSWMQTPAGFHIVQMVRDGKPWIVNGRPVLRAEMVDFWQVLFNHSTVIRVWHTLIGAFILGSFFIMSISAYYLLRRRHEEFARRSFTGGLIFATITSLGALVSGDTSGRVVYAHQPAKLGAMEGHFVTDVADLTLFGIPDPEHHTVHLRLAIPRGLTFLVHRNLTEPVVGLDEFAPEDWPPVVLPFAAFHIMVGLGTIFIGLTLLASFLRWRGKLFEQRWLLWIFVFAVVGPFISNEAGWVTAEVGRQPWVVHPPAPWGPDGKLVRDDAGFVKYDTSKALRTTAAASEAVDAEQVLASIILFAAIYALLFALWIFLLDRKIRHGPEPAPALPAGTGAKGFMAAAEARPTHERGMAREEQEEQKKAPEEEEEKERTR